MVFWPIMQFTFPHTFSVQFLTGIIPRQAMYHEMSIRSLVFGKAIVVCGSNHPCPTTYDLEHHFQLFGDFFSTWLLSTIHHNDQPAVQSPYILYHSDTTPALFCGFGTYNTIKIFSKPLLVRLSKNHLF